MKLLGEIVINIFFLHESPVTSAIMQCDKHVVKMIVETAQMLSTAHRILDGVQTIRISENGRKLKYWELPDHRETKLYKATHVNHPSSVWARENDHNYTWLRHHFMHLCAEYTHRYDKIHATQTKLSLPLMQIPNNIKSTQAPTPIPLCMPDEYKVLCPVESYRNYYRGGKAEIAKWNKSRPAPSWWQL